MKVAYIFGTFPVPTQTFAISDLNALADLGIEIDVFSLSRCDEEAARASGWRGSSYQKISVRELIPRTAVAWRRLAAGLQRVLPALATNPMEALGALLCLPRAVAISARLEEGGYDVAHAFWGRHPILPLALVAAVPARPTPKLSVFVGAYDLVYEGFLVRWGLKIADIVFTHSHENLPFFRHKARPGVDVHVVHRGIPVELLSASKVTRKPLSVVTVSALTIEKNVRTVIDGFAHFLALHAGSKLTIIGDGPCRRELEHQASMLGIADAVSFLGHQPRADVARHLAASDFFVFASRKRSERLPNVLKEALFAGCRVVTAPSVGISELIPNETVGTVVHSVNGPALSAAMEALLKVDPAEVEARRLRNRAFIENEFSSTGSMSRYVDHWQNSGSDLDRKP